MPCRMDYCAERRFPRGRMASVQIFDFSKSLFKRWRYDGGQAFEPFEFLQCAAGSGHDSTIRGRRHDAQHCDCRRRRFSASTA
jgi:hypothetical protein